MPPGAMTRSKFGNGFFRVGQVFHDMLDDHHPKDSHRQRAVLQRWRPASGSLQPPAWIAPAPSD